MFQNVLCIFRAVDRDTSNKLLKAAKCRLDNCSLRSMAVLVGRGTGSPSALCVFVRASEVIWSEYTRIISILSDAK